MKKDASFYAAVGAFALLLAFIWFVITNIRKPRETDVQKTPEVLAQEEAQREELVVNLQMPGAKTLAATAIKHDLPPEKVLKIAHLAIIAELRSGTHGISFLEMDQKEKLIAYWEKEIEAIAAEVQLPRKVVAEVIMATTGSSGNDAGSD